MHTEDPNDKAGAGDSKADGAAGKHNPKPAPDPQVPKEIGGRDGPDPTRYGDWEKAGRCIDF